VQKGMPAEFAVEFNALNAAKGSPVFASEDPIAARNGSLFLTSLFAEGNACPPNSA
jgi:hypothetical protein